MIQLDIDAAPDSPAKINLHIEHITKRMVANVPDYMADLLRIACYVFCADQFTSRGPRTMQGMGAKWRRRFRFIIPVADISLWQRSEVGECLVDVLSFLADDDHAFQFVARKRPSGLAPYLELLGDGPPSGFKPDSIILFSGGLDSLTGAAETLLEQHERVALVSHRSSPMLQSRQTALVERLRERTSPKHVFDIGIAANKGHQEARDFTQRSRSFLFAALGFVVARLFAKKELSFFENGIVSLNLPVSEHVLGSRATRTTHPRVLAGFSKLFSLISDADFRVHNPFFWLTKTEILRKLAGTGCADLLPVSFSCTRVREATKTGKHCGVCSQCIDRRFAVLAAGLKEHEPSDLYSVDLFMGEREPGPDLTFAEFYVLTASKFASMTEVAFLSRYGQAYRALPFLAGSCDRNAARLHQLHADHGTEIAHVVSAAINAGATLPGALDLPPHSLLSLIQSTAAKQLIDIAETEPAASRQAAEMRLIVVDRPIRFAIDEANSRALFPRGVMLEGALYRLFSKLADVLMEDREAGLHPKDHRYTKTRILAEKLDIVEPTVRQNVSRLRRCLDARFSQAGTTILPDDVIQNDAWHGYRLNPQMAPTPIAHLTESLPTECHASAAALSQLDR